MEFEPRHIVNGSLLRNFIGKNISIIVEVEDCSGLLIKAKTTDGNNVRINLTEPMTIRSSEWVEVIGKPAGPDIIRSKEIICFDKDDQDFDYEAHNILVQLLQHSIDVLYFG